MIAKLTIDSGSEGHCIRKDICQKLGIRILPLHKNDQRIPTQAFGLSPLEIVGYTRFRAIRGKVTLYFKGYVAKTLNSEILCGAPFMERKRLVQELNNKRIIIDGKYVFLENSPFCPKLQPEVGVSQVVDKPATIHSTEDQN